MRRDCGAERIVTNGRAGLPDICLEGRKSGSGAESEARLSGRAVRIRACSQPKPAHRPASTIARPDAGPCLNLSGHPTSKRLKPRTQTPCQKEKAREI